MEKFEAKSVETYERIVKNTFQCSEIYKKTKLVITKSAKNLGGESIDNCCRSHSNKVWRNSLWDENCWTKLSGGRGWLFWSLAHVVSTNDRYFLPCHRSWDNSSFKKMFTQYKSPSLLIFTAQQVSRQITEYPNKLQWYTPWLKGKGLLYHWEWSLFIQHRMGKEEKAQKLYRIYTMI